MGKKHTVFCLNGPNKGEEIEVEETYTLEEESLKKRNMAFTYDGIDYAGYCRACGDAVRLDQASYQSNTNYYGTLRVDVFHRRCL